MGEGGEGVREAGWERGSRSWCKALYTVRKLPAPGPFTWLLFRLRTTPPVPRSRQCLTTELGGGSCVHFPPKIRPWNQGLVLADDRGQPRTAEKKFSGVLRRGMRALSFPTVNHIDK